MPQSPDPWLDLAAKRGVRGATPSAAGGDDPWMSLAAKRNLAPADDGPGPVEGGFLSRVGNMGLKEWSALATRVIPGIFTTAGGPVGAAVGAGSELLAQLQEGRLAPWEILAEAGVGAIPFGKLGKSAIEGTGALAKAGNLLAGTAKGAAIGATSATVRPAIAEGRLPTREEFLTGTALGAGGGAAVSGLARGVGGWRSKPTEIPPSSGQGTLNFDVPINTNLDPAAPAMAPLPKPRILKGKDVYKGTYPTDRPITDPVFAGRAQRAPRQDSLDDLMELMGIENTPRLMTGADRYRPTGSNLGFDAPNFGSQRAPYLREMGDRPSPFGSPLDDATQDPLAVLEDLFAGGSAKVSPSMTVGASPGRVGLMERLRESADMGRPNVPQRGDTEVLPPARPGEDDFLASARAADPNDADDMATALMGRSQPPAPETAALAEAVLELPAAEQRAIVRQFSDLNPEEGRELKRILAEMNAFGFERGAGPVIETVDGLVEELAPTGLLRHTAGAPVFHDIMGGARGTRRSAIDALERFINQGKRPTRIAQRAIDVARRRLSGDRDLTRPVLPPDAGLTGDEARAWLARQTAESPTPSWDDDLAAVGAEPLPIPDEITNLWKSLRPKWQQAVEAQKDDDIPFTVDPTEELDEFARRLATSPRRQLFGAERKVVDELPPDKMDLLRRLFAGGDESGSGELGAINPELLYHLGATGLGAAGGTLFDSGDNPAASAVGGGLLGLLASLRVKDPQLVRRMRSSGLFSGAAIPKSALGNVGALSAYAAEHPGTAGIIAKELRDPQTGAALKAGWNRPMAREGEQWPTDSPFSYPGRSIGSVDAMTRDVLQRVQGAKYGGNLPGIPTAAQGDVGGYYTLSGDPLSKTGQWALEGQNKSAVMADMFPVVRTPVNWLERGVERLPGVGGAKTIRNWTGASDDLVKRRQALGALAILAGVGGGAAAASTPGGVDETILPFVAAAAGPYGLPLTLGVEGGKALFKDGGTALSALEAMGGAAQENLPLPSDYSARPSRMLRSYLPYAAAGRMFSPVDPRELDTSGSFFGPTLAQIPLLNELLFERKRKARPRVEFTPPASR